MYASPLHYECWFFYAAASAHALRVIDSHSNHQALRTKPEVEKLRASGIGLESFQVTSQGHEIVPRKDLA